MSFLHRMRWSAGRLQAALPGYGGGLFSERCIHSGTSHGPQFGIMFDIDGVLTRGKKVFPAALAAFQKLVGDDGRFRVPVIFVTNAGNSLRSSKAQALTRALGVKISKEQVVMAHSPLRMFKQFHNRRVLVSGQGPLKEIADGLGFTNVCTVEDVRQAFPVLDVVDQKRRETLSTAIDQGFPPVEAVVLMQEPAEWETALQLIVDVLMTDGRLLEHRGRVPYPHIPLLACNMDLQWMAEAWIPRFGHGAFLLCLEELYKKITGYDLVYTALVGKPSEITMHHADLMAQQHAKSIGLSEPVRRIYFIGDNLNTDIFGANLYQRYLARREPLTMDRRGNVEPEIRVPMADVDCAHECYSILVETGVSNATTGTVTDLNHSPRDFLPVEASLRRPSFCVRDVLSAVELVFDRERFL